jgi:hypothetical protein
MAASRPIRGLKERDWKRDLESLNRLRAAILVETHADPSRSRAAIAAIDELINHVLALTNGVEGERMKYTPRKAV